MTVKFKINGKNTGKDVSVTIKDSLGETVNAAQLGILTEFNITADYALLETKSIVNGGRTYFESLPHGAKCSLKFARSGPGLSKMENKYRKNSFNGVQLSYTLQWEVQERAGLPVTTQSLVDGKPHNWNLGDYKPDSNVPCSVDFVFGDMDLN